MEQRGNGTSAVVVERGDGPRETVVELPLYEIALGVVGSGEIGGECLLDGAFALRGAASMMRTKLIGPTPSTAARSSPAEILDP